MPCLYARVFGPGLGREWDCKTGNIRHASAQQQPTEAGRQASRTRRVMRCYVLLLELAGQRRLLAQYTADDATDQQPGVIHSDNNCD